MIFRGLENIRKEKRDNQKVVSLLFSSLNRPKTDFSLSGVSDVLMENFYNAVGQKLKKTVIYSDSIKIVDYLDGFQYAGGALQFFPHPEGYVKATPVMSGNNITGYTYNYVFNYTDHLGNVRVSYSKDPQTSELKILEENHYYPFGLKHSVYSGGRLKGFKATLGSIGGTVLTPVTKTDYQYKYNGKEWQDELGLNMYDMDMRQYDPAIARWVVLDPVIHHSMSPYNAFDNNPVFWADPSGADAVMSAFPDRNLDTFGTMNTVAIGQMKDEQNMIAQMEAVLKENKSEKYEYSSGQRASQDNGDPKKKDQKEGSSKENKGATVAGSAYSALGEHGQKSLESGEYIQTNGEKGNFNDRSYNRLSRNGKAHFDRAKGLSNLRLLGTAGNIYSFGDGAWKDFNSFANGQPSIENTAVATGGIVGGIVGGAAAGGGASLMTGNPYVITGSTIVGGILGSFLGEEAVRELFNTSYDYNNGTPFIHKR